MNVLFTSAGPALVLLAVLALAVIFVFATRWIELRRAQVPYADFLHGVINVLRQDNPQEALALCDETTAPVTRIVAAAVRNRSGSARVQREAVDATGHAEVGRLERRISVLAAIGQIAPLIGLVGTFCGFIRAALALGASEALVMRADLVSGLVPALVSAAAGLSVSVLAHVAYAVLRARLDRLTFGLEAAASEILAFLAAEREDRIK